MPEPSPWRHGAVSYGIYCTVVVFVDEQSEFMEQQDRILCFADKLKRAMTDGKTIKVEGTSGIPENAVVKLTCNERAVIEINDFNSKRLVLDPPHSFGSDSE